MTSHRMYYPGARGRDPRFWSLARLCDFLHLRAGSVGQRDLVRLRLLERVAAIDPQCERVVKLGLAAAAEEDSTLAGGAVAVVPPPPPAPEG